MSNKSTSENAVEIADKIYDSRRALRGIWGNDYKQKIAEYEIFIHAEMSRNSVGALQATFNLVKILSDKVPDSGFGIMAILSACAEILEPTSFAA